MQVSISWLNEFVDLTDKTPEEIAHELTMSGLEVEEIEEIKPKFTNIVTAKIEKIDQHPNADKLHLVTINNGSGLKTVVCGAQNIAEGQIIPYASVGSNVLNRKTGEQFTLTPAVIRGVESQGMLCSADELGVDDRNYQEEDGILILNRIFPDVKIGEDVEKVLGFDHDVVLHVAPTANRGDEMSVIGIARELCALFDKQLKQNYVEVDETIPDKGFGYKTKIEKTGKTIRVPRSLLRYWSNQGYWIWSKPTSQRSNPIIKMKPQWQRHHWSYPVSDYQTTPVLHPPMDPVGHF